MMVRRLLPVVCLLLVSGTCFGQAIGLYFNPIVTRASNSQPDNGTFAFLGQGNTSALRGGVSLGGYYLLSQGPRASFGIDLRDEWQGGNDSLLNSFLLGVRVAGHVGTRLKPYAEVLGGAGTTRAPLTVVRTSKAMVKGYAGLDYTLNRHLDFRPVEIGYGELSTTSTARYLGTSYPSAQLLSFSAGLVARFGK